MGYCLGVPSFFKWSSEVVAGGTPDDFVACVRSAYEELGRRAGVPDPIVAVRSSAVDEDGASASFAGVYISILNVRGVDAVVDAVRKCWASAADRRVLEYRRSKGLGPAPLAVLVQEMIAADTAAVVFSTHPSGSCDEIVVNANYGLGESIVSGVATPDTWMLLRSDLSVRQMMLGAKEKMTVYDGDNGTREVAVLRTLRRRPCLKPDQVRQLAEMALGLERHFGWPVDIETAFRDEKLFLLQCRPITTTSKSL
ncbi:MAG: PEP/pyruvate-binding domain-containing protein [Nannocystaceae bacterium]